VWLTASSCCPLHAINTLLPSRSHASLAGWTSPVTGQTVKAIAFFFSRACSVRRLYLASLGNINRREKLVSKRKRPASGSRRLELQLSLPLNSHQKRPRLGPCYDDLCLLRQGNPLPIFKTRRRTYLTFNLDRNSHVALAWLCLGGTHDPEVGERCWHGCVLLPPFVFDTRLDPNRFSTNLMRATVLSSLTEKINAASLSCLRLPLRFLRSSLLFYSAECSLSLSLPHMIGCRVGPQA
jgi:hypothetical protein